MDQGRTQRYHKFTVGKGWIPEYGSADDPKYFNYLKSYSPLHNLKAGGRYLVQADWRDLKTKGSNGAFGYNFEGALQEYVLMDERVITSPDGESMLLPAAEDLAASAIASPPRFRRAPPTPASIAS